MKETRNLECIKVKNRKNIALNNRNDYMKRESQALKTFFVRSNKNKFSFNNNGKIQAMNVYIEIVWRFYNVKHTAPRRIEAEKATERSEKYIWCAHRTNERTNKRNVWEAHRRKQIHALLVRETGSYWIETNERPNWSAETNDFMYIAAKIGYRDVEWTTNDDMKQAKHSHWHWHCHTTEYEWDSVALAINPMSNECRQQCAAYIPKSVGFIGEANAQRGSLGECFSPLGIWYEMMIVHFHLFHLFVWCDDAITNKKWLLTIAICAQCIQLQSSI